MELRNITAINVWLVFCVIHISLCASPLQVLYSFKVPKFIEGGLEETVGSNVAIIDVDYWKDPGSNGEKIFVTTPRGKPGTPATLSTITNDTNNQPILAPYPSWEANQATCENIVSAFRTQIDSCNRLWVIDAGYINSFTDTSERICPPKIVIYDLITDTLINKYEFTDDILKPETLVTTIVVDIRDNKCDEAFAYVADPNTYQLVVFSLKEARYWNYRNRLLYPYPLDGSFKINGVTFDFMDGVIGLALGPVIKGDRTLFLHSLASRRESNVQTSILRNSELAGDNTAAVQQFKVSYGERTSQSAVDAIWDGVLYFNLLGENTIACWPTNTPYTKGNIRRLCKDEEKIQFVSGMKTISGNMWMISSKLQNYITDTIDENVINYRVIKSPIDKLTKGRGCRR